jgi:hypothetical protein
MVFRIAKLGILSNDAENAVGLMVVLVVAVLEAHRLENNERAQKPERQPDDVDERVRFGMAKLAQAGLDVVPDHGGKG